MAGMGLGSFLEGVSGGMQLGMSMDRNKKMSDALENMAAKNGSGGDAGSGTAIQNAAAQPGSMGLPGQMPPQSSFDDLGSNAGIGMGYNPTQSQVMPSSPQAKTATNNSGNWGTIASFF